MNFVLKFLQKKSIRIAELEKAAESHNHIVGGYKAAFTKLKARCLEAEMVRDGLMIQLNKLTDPDAPPKTDFNIE